MKLVNQKTVTVFGVSAVCNKENHKKIFHRLILKTGILEKSLMRLLN